MTRTPAAGRAARLGLLVLGAVLAIATVEVFIRVWAATVEGREEPAPSSGDHEVVLCIGDSHTWGRGAGYPQRLSKGLADRSDRYRVINLGVPGTNTAQLRKRIDDQLTRYDPSLLVVWSGVNNAWNQSAVEVRERVPRLTFWDRLARVSRISRFFRVWRHQRALEALLADAEPHLVPESSVEKDEEGARYERTLGRKTAVYVNEGGAGLRGESLSDTTRDDLVWIIEKAESHGVPTILVAYGLPGGRYGEASVGIRQAARLTGAGLVEASNAGATLARRFSKRDATLPRLYDDTVHPTQLLYREIGDRILALAEGRGWLPPAPGPARGVLETAP